MRDLKNKVALVTGGARGLGLAICQNLVEAGSTVITADIDEPLVRKAAETLSGNGGRIEPLALDVSDRGQVEQAARAIVSAYGSLDILINNAGIDVTLSVEELAVEDWDRIIATNLRGPFLTSKAVFPIMKGQGRGHIVNIASTAAKRAWANASAYHASKWGLLGFSHALHVEARPHNVKVTAVVVGGMKTPFLLDRFPDIDASTLQDPMNVARTIEFILLQPEETVLPEVMVLPMRETSWP
jgi:NAD(P)-dependent dehydrogenase (short-subunit alcohol dehydrogenase family)